MEKEQIVDLIFDALRRHQKCPDEMEIDENNNIHIKVYEDEKCDNFKIIVQ